MKAYTPPEMSTERLTCGRIRAIVNRCGGCGVCLNRDKALDAWDRGFCAIPNRIFPRCLSEHGLKFEPDWDKIKEAA